MNYNVDDYFFFESPIHLNTFKKYGFDLDLEENKAARDFLLFSFPQNGLTVGVKKDAVKHLIVNKDIKLTKIGYKKYEKKKLETLEDLLEFLTLSLDIEEF